MAESATEKSLIDLIKEVQSSNSKLLRAQKETTRQLMTEEQRAAAEEADSLANQKRVEGGRKAWETRQSKKLAEDSSILGKIANFLSFGKGQAAAEAEKASKQKSRDSKMMGYLKSTAGFLGGIAKQGMQKVKSGLEGFSKFAFGALAIAALAFLNSPYFDKIYDVIVDKIIPVLVKLYEKYLQPLLIIMKDKLIKAFEDINKFLDGELDIFELLWNNKVVIAGFLAVFAPGVLLAPLKLGGGLILKGLKAAYGSKLLAPVISSLKDMLGPAALLGGVILMIKDGIAGMDLAKEFGVRKISGFFGGLLGGLDDGITGAFKNAGKFALIGMGLGSIFPVIGTLFGGLVGGIIGAMLGFFGGEKIAKVIDELINMLTGFLNRLILKGKKLADKVGVREMTEQEKADLAEMEADDAAKEQREELIEKRKRAIKKLQDNRARMAEEQANREASLQKQREKVEELEKKFREADEEASKEDAGFWDKSHRANVARALKEQKAFLKNREEFNKSRNEAQDKQVKVFREQEEQLKIEIAQNEAKLKGKVFSVDKKTPDASSVKPKEKESVSIVNANDQKVVKIDNKEEKTFVGATNMKSVDDAAAVLAQIG